MENKRSVGITIVAVIMLIYSFLWLSANFILSLPFERGAHTPSIFRTLYLIATIFFAILIAIMRFKQIGFLLGLIYLIASINILKLKKWARLLAVYCSSLMGLFYIFILIVSFISGFTEGFSGDTGFAWGMGFLVMMTPVFIPIFLFIIYFTRPKVKEQFR